MKRILAFLLASLMAVGLLSACGGEGKNDEERVGNITLSYKNADSEEMTIKEYSGLLSSNEVKFKKINEGASLMINGYVQEVKSPTTVNGIKFHHGYIYLTSEKSPFEDKGFAMDGIYVSLKSQEGLEDIDLNSFVTVSGKYWGYINTYPIVEADSNIEILNE